jgi:hypothetical protein
MPFIRGRYHMNPTMGNALEAAREAEAALLALEQQAQQGRNSAEDDESPDNESADDGAGAIHRVEIDAAEQEGLPGRRQGEPGRSDPSSSGRAARGYVARLHRAPTGRDAQSSQRTSHPPPETHVFSDHRDLVNFL